MQPMLDTSHLPRVPEWKKAGDFEDILYEKSEEGIAKITINPAYRQVEEGWH